MRTISLNFAKKAITVLSIYFIATAFNTNAQDVFAYDNSRFVEEFDAVTENNTLPAAEQVKEVRAEISKWIENEVRNSVNDCYLGAGTYEISVSMKVNELGKLETYEIANTKDFEISQMLSNILEKAPRFDVITMNGYKASMHYNIPLTIVVR